MSGVPDSGSRSKPVPAAGRLLLGLLVGAVGAMGWTLLLLTSPTAALGEGVVRMTMADKVFQAESIVEVRLPLAPRAPAI